MIYLKKYDPRVKVYLSDGSFCEFEPVERMTGIFATSDPRIEKELRKAMSDGRGAMEEITEADYRAFLEQKKSSTPSPPPYREELGKKFALPPTGGSPPSKPSVPPSAQPPVAARPAVAAEPNRPKTRGNK